MRLMHHSKYIPPDRLSISEIVRKKGHNIFEACAFARLFGFENVATIGEMSLVEVFVKLLEGIDFSDNAPSVVIYCHGNPTQYAGEVSPVAEAVERHPALSGRCAIFELDQQTCATLFWALDAARGFLREGADSVLIIAGDSVEALPLDERHSAGVTAVGDAFVALHLDNAETGTQVGEVFLDAHHEYHQGRTATNEEAAAFNNAHTELVQKILDRVKLKLNRPFAILPHNVNRLVWQKFAKDTGTKLADIWLDLLPDIGHCYTVDGATHLDRFETSEKQDATLLSVGQGGFLGGCNLHKEATICRL